MTANDNPDWIVAFVLPNLQLEQPIDEEAVSLVPSSDTRLQQCVEKNAAAGQLINGFTDQFGAKKNVSALIYRHDAISRKDLLPALISFRNLFALSCILNGWQCFIGNPNVFWTLYSDYFDCYPWAPGANGKDLIQIGPAQESVRKADGFRGQSSPDLPQMGALLKASPDETVLLPLLTAWCRRFLRNGRPDRRTIALFRSLAVAYQAAALPIKNASWIFDYGTSIGLWISAFEILVHPSQNKASLQDVLNLFEKATWINRKLAHRRFEIVVRKRKQRVNLAKALYWQLYNARNDFLHGNRVKARSLFVHQNRELVDLTKVAPLLYGLALRCFFGIYQRRRTGNIVAIAFQKIDECSSLEHALIHLAVPISRWGEFES